MPTNRQEKVNSLLQREISTYLRDRDFEEISGVLTITGAEVTPDLEEAKIFFSVIGQEPAEVQRVLQTHLYEIQGMLNRRLRMRKVPRIVFVFDSSGEYAQRINELIQKLHQDGD